MKKILVTGATGFLGSRIVPFFSDRYVVYAPTHSEMDISNKTEVNRIFRDYIPDYVIHCAAMSDVGRCEKEPELSWKINVEGSVNIALAAANLSHSNDSKDTKCIICSSDQVYFGSKLDGSHEENEELKPFNLYGREKLTAENECLRVNSDCVLLRLSWMFDDKIINKQEHDNFFTPLLKALKNSDTICYPIYDIRGITDVDEVIQNIEKAFLLPGGVYNFGAPNNQDTFYTMNTIFQMAGLNESKIQKNEQAFFENPRNISMSQDKVNQNGIYFTSTQEGIRKKLVANDYKL